MTWIPLPAVVQYFVNLAVTSLLQYLIACNVSLKSIFETASVSFILVIPPLLPYLTLSLTGVGPSGPAFPYMQIPLKVQKVRYRHKLGIPQAGS
jgi:hypothetical protein